MTMTYAPEPTEQTMRLASVAAAKHFGTEAIQIHGCVEDPEHTVVIYRVDGWNPKGWNNLGPSVAVHVSDDGEVTVSDDD